MASELQALERVALEVAREAADFVMQGFRQHFQVSKKAEDELFTEYDVGSEELVRKALARHTPEIPVVGEEQGGEAGEDLTWYIDPIDGTVNFIAGHPWFAVSLGLVQRGYPVAGAVVAPALGLSWSASVGIGASKNGTACRVNENPKLSDAIVSTGFPSRRGVFNSEHELRLQQYGRICRNVREVRRCGSAAIELCMVADGTYDVYWMRHLPHWDTSAGAAAVLAAGGNWTQRESGTAKAQDLATNGHLDGAMAFLLDES
jgi:myo-inositol-1(or 4)-monophosphatase